jgi:hypothetical protein
MNSESVNPTLYDRLCGFTPLLLFVDDFIDRVISNRILNVNPAADEAHHRVSPAGFKYLVAEMVCWATGPQQYSGRPHAARRAIGSAQCPIWVNVRRRAWCPGEVYFFSTSGLTLSGNRGRGAT